VSITEITNDADVIDSRDIKTRIADLETQRDEGNDYGEDEAAELASLQVLASAGESASADWHYGETLIRDSYFEDYARDTAESIGAIQSDAGWPMDYIDWPAAADALKMDYTSVDFDGVTYWVR